MDLSSNTTAVSSSASSVSGLDSHYHHHHHSSSASSSSSSSSSSIGFEHVLSLPDLPSGVVDVDALDMRKAANADPGAVADYAREIHAHQKKEEVSWACWWDKCFQGSGGELFSLFVSLVFLFATPLHLVSSSFVRSCLLLFQVLKSARYGYMAHQTDINEKMRAILLDWLEEVHVKFKLMPETLYLTANLIDRFLEKKIVIRSKLQLVGVTAMLIASKYEEIYAPEVRDFVYITDKAYTREQILAMEATMLNTLDFRVSVPTVLVFLNRYLKVANGGTSPSAEDRLARYATFLVERQVQEYRMLQHAPSKVAAAAVNMALRTLKGRSAWTPTLEFHTGYSERDLKACILDMQDVMQASVGSSLQAVRKKYSNPKFGEVAGIPLIPLE